MIFEPKRPAVPFVEIPQQGDRYQQEQPPQIGQQLRAYFFIQGFVAGLGVYFYVAGCCAAVFAGAGCLHVVPCRFFSFGIGKRAFAFAFKNRFTDKVTVGAVLLDAQGVAFLAVVFQVQIVLAVLVQCIGQNFIIQLIGERKRCIHGRVKF